MTVKKNYYKLLKSEESEHIMAIQEYSINIRSREIFLHGFKELPMGDDEEELGLSFREAQKFLKNVTILNNISKDPILVHMHTIGGEWRDSIAIYDVIKASHAPVILIGYAQVRSMSSIIMQAADLRVMMPNTDFMLHHGESTYSGEVQTAQSQAEWDRIRTTPTMMKIYADSAKRSDRFRGKKKAVILEFLNDKLSRKGDWYLTSTESVQHGFADGVFGSKGFESLEKIRSKRVIKRR